MREFKKIPQEETAAASENDSVSLSAEESVSQDANSNSEANANGEQTDDTSNAPQYPTLEEALYPDATPKLDDNKAISNTEGNKTEEITEEEVNEDNAGNNSDTLPSSWEQFQENISLLKKRGRTEQSRVCHIDISIAMAIDECIIEGTSREMKINAILMTFIKTHLKEFKECRKGISYLDIIGGAK